MTNAELTTQSAYFTEAQAACRIARTSGKRVDLLAAAAMIDSPRYDELPDGAKVDLAAAYSAALIAQTGALQ